MFDDMKIKSKGNEITIRLTSTISCTNPQDVKKQLELAQLRAFAESVTEGSCFREFVETYKTMAVIDDSWNDIREDFYNVFEDIFKETFGDFDGDTIDNTKYNNANGLNAAYEKLMKAISEV